MSAAVQSLALAAVSLPEGGGTPSGTIVSVHKARMQRASSGHRETDAMLVEEMAQLIRTNQARNRWDAASMLASRAKGSGGPETKQRRLSDRYAETYPEVETAEAQ